MIVKTNDNSKLILFYLIFDGGVGRGGGYVFYLRAWSTTLPSLTVGGWSWRMEGGGVMEVFPPIFKMGSQNKMVW